MRGITLREMQKIELDLLLVLDKVCKEHGLRYYLDGGTLLGAMCYEGFIPWDDDIDVKMPRPDYEKLIQFQSDFPEYIRIVAPSLAYCEYLFMKLIDDRTLLTETSGGVEKGTGVYIDILPMDGHPQEEREWNKHLWKLQRYNSLFHNALTHFASMKKSDSLKIRIKGKLYDRLYTPWRLYCMLTRLAKKYKYDECETVGLLVDGDAIRERFERRWLDEPVQLEFEGYMFPAPAAYEKHLQIFYGEHINKKACYHNLPMILPDHQHKVYWKD